MTSINILSSYHVKYRTHHNPNVHSLDSLTLCMDARPQNRHLIIHSSHSIQILLHYLSNFSDNGGHQVHNGFNVLGSLHNCSWYPHLRCSKYHNSILIPKWTTRLVLVPFIRKKRFGIIFHFIKMFHLITQVMGRPYEHDTILGNRFAEGKKVKHGEFT